MSQQAENSRRPRQNNGRRRFLRSVAGAGMALPWLESLSAALPEQSLQRLAIFYVPIGVVRRGFFPGEADAAVPVFNGGEPDLTVQRDLQPGVYPLQQLTPTQQPLESLRHKVTLITGLDRTYRQGTDVHAQCASCFLTSGTPQTVTSSPYPLDRTLDQIVADHIGGETPFRSLELSCNSHNDNRESIWFDNISWYGTGHVAPSMRDPQAIYQRLFGTQENAGLRRVTDLVMEDARAIQRRLSVADRSRFAEYFDGVRTLEQQLDLMDLRRRQISGDIPIDEPIAAHMPRSQYLDVMCQLMVVALQTGMTRVATMMIGPERWDTPFLYDTLSDKPMSHHGMSHNQPKFLEQLLQVDRFHMEQFARMAARMDSIQEANGKTLLDNTLLTYGSGLGDGSTHQYTDLPIIVAGSGAGRLRTGLHLHCSQGSRLADLWLTQCHSLGLNLPRFADSEGLLSDLLT